MSFVTKLFFICDDQFGKLKTENKSSFVEYEMGMDYFAQSLNYFAAEVLKFFAETENSVKKWESLPKLEIMTKI